MTTQKIMHTPGPWSVYEDANKVAAHGAKNRAYGTMGEYFTESITDQQGNFYNPADARFVAAAPDLLYELQAAHQIILNALNSMLPEQKLEWAVRNARDGVDGEGATRANERAAVIIRAIRGAQ